MKTILISVLFFITSGLVVAQDNLTASAGIENEKSLLKTKPAANEPAIKIVTTDAETVSPKKSKPALSVARVIINDAGDMVEISEFEANRTMSQQPVTKYAVDVFPTPAEGLVNIQLREKKLADGNIKVYDMHGQLVEHMVFKGSYVSMEFAEKTPGIYVLHLEAGNGTVKGLYKIVKVQ